MYDLHSDDGNQISVDKIWGGGEVVRTEGIKNSYNILVDKPRRNGPQGSMHR